jgi:hypothetical protein
MRPKSIAAAVLTLIAALSNSASADPLTGTIELTIPPGTPRLAYTSYSSGSVDLSTLPQNIPLPGPPLGPNSAGAFTQTIDTTFNLRITFDGASGFQPVVDITGPLVGTIGGNSITENMGGQFTATPTSATLENWSPDSGIPLSLINQYLNTASYQIDGAIEGGGTNLLGFLMTVNPSTPGSPVPAPEPATILVFVVAFAGMSVRRAVRRNDPCAVVPRSH